MTASGPFAMGPALAGTSARRTAPRSNFAPVAPPGGSGSAKLGAGLTQTTAPSLKKEREREAEAARVKKEEEEVELLLPSTHSDWSKALVSSYVTSSVNARYDLAMLLIVMLLFLTDEIPQWDSSLLGEILVVFRGIAMLQHTSRQPAGLPHPPSSDLGDDDDDIVRKLRNLDVSAGHARFEPSYSLLHRLFTPYCTPSVLPGAAHNFLDATGLLTGLTPAHASKWEVQFCDRLRLLGYREAARDALAWLPRTPAVTYVLLRVWLDEGRYEDAAAALESLAWCFGMSFISFRDPSYERGHELRAKIQIKNHQSCHRKIRKRCSAC